MAVVFYIPGALRPFTGGRDRVELTGEGGDPAAATSDETLATLRDALELLWMLYPGIRDRVVNEQGQLREHINLFVGNEDVRYTGGLMTPLHAGAEIWIIAAVSGG
jgi:molybdopterin synthase sulfur carrier subunit